MKNSVELETFNFDREYDVYSKEYTEYSQERGTKILKSKNQTE